VNLEDGTVSIKHSNGGARLLPMPDGLVYVLSDGYDVTGPDGPVFVTSRGKSPESDYMSQSFRRICRLAGVSTGAFHVVKHGTAAALLTAGASTRDVQDILGRSIITTTEKYLRIVDGRLRGLLDTTFNNPG
jgi:site-specific recombinase XerD